MTKPKLARKVKSGTATKKAAGRRKPVQPKSRAKSKQAEVLELLRRPPGFDNSRHHEGHWLATTYRPGLLRGRRAQKARPHFGVREAR
jgi:hypothetical protein